MFTGKYDKNESVMYLLQHKVQGIKKNIKNMQLGKTEAK